MAAQFHSLSDELNAQRDEYTKQGEQWCEYDKLARLASMRDVDMQAVHRSSTCPALRRLALREEWRVEQEVHTLSMVARQDSTRAANDVSFTPLGQLPWGGTSGELRNLQEEELGFLHCLVSDELAKNAYHSESGRLWKGTVDHKAEVARTTADKFRTQAEAHCSISGSLFDALHDVAQLIHLCEINLKRQAAGSAAGVLVAEEMDPFLHCCRRMAGQRARWLQQMQDAQARCGDGTDLLIKLRRAPVTLRKIEEYRVSQIAQIRPQGDAGSAVNTQHSKKVVQASQPSAIPLSPSVPAPLSTHKPRTITPSIPDDPKPVVVKEKKPEVVIVKAKRRSTTLSRELAVFRLARWWRRCRYWRRVCAVWRGLVKRQAKEGAQKHLQHMKHIRTTRDLTSRPSACTAALQIQRAFRGHRGRYIAATKRRAVHNVQKIMRGCVARKVIPLRKTLAEVRERRRGGQLLRRLVEEHNAEADIVDGYVEAVLNLTAELQQTRLASQEEESTFRREWKQWEDKLSHTCLTEVPLDAEWAPQQQQDGSTHYLNLKTKRTTAEHPNLKLAEIHRKRQWVKVSRIRDERRKLFSTQIAKLEHALEGRREAFPTEIHAMRVRAQEFSL